MVGHDERGQGAVRTAPWHRTSCTEITIEGRPVGRQRGAVELESRPLTRLTPTPLKRRGRNANGVPRHYPKAPEPGPWMRESASGVRMPRSRARLTPRTFTH